MALTQRQLEWAKSNGIDPEKALPVATSTDKLTPDAVYSYLSNKGISDTHAKGIIANIKAESDFNPEAYGDNGTSAGLFQHHKERLSGLQSNPEWKDWKNQIDYALNEDEGRDYLTQKFNRPEEASAYFTKNFERPANAEYEADRRKSFIPNIAPTTPVLTERQKRWAKENGISIQGEKEEPKEENVIQQSLRGWGGLLKNPKVEDALKRATVSTIPPSGLLPGLSDTRKQMASEISEAPEILKDKLGLNADYGNKGLNLARNVSKGIVDVGVGFPAQVASGALNLPEELQSDVKDPKRLLEVAKQAGSMLAAPYNYKEYTPEKLYEDPVGRVMLALQGLGLASGVKGLIKKPITPNIVEPSSIEQTPISTDIINQKPISTPIQEAIINKSLSKKPINESVIPPDIIQGRAKGLNLKKVETLDTANLLNEAFLDVKDILKSERGSISNKEKIISDRAIRARKELLNRARVKMQETGKLVEDTLADMGLSPEQIQSIIINSPKVGADHADKVLKVTPSGELVPLSKGGETVPLNIIKNLAEWKDINQPQTQYKDFDRILEKVTGKDYNKVRPFLTEAREGAVTNLISEVSKYKDEVKNYIVKELGIKPGSQESAAVMKYGEGRLSEADLKKSFPNEWQNIVKANDYYRSNYDRILDEVNTVLESQNKPPIPKRKNYYTHVQEIASLWDQLKNPAAIDPQLAGLSEFTQPTGRWNPFAQKRQGGKFVEDAVEAFDRYLMPTLMQKHLNPVISRYQAFADALAAQSIKTRNLNNLIWTTRMQARSLAGKTNPFDRSFQDIVGRKAMRAVDWTAQRLAANSIVGNLGSAVMQSSSLPQTIAHTGLFNTTKGMLSSLMDATSGKNTAIEMSPFLKRRYLNVEPLKKTLTQKAADVASVPMKYFEQFMVESTWRANFNKAFSEGMKKPEAIKYADLQTARQVGDRSLGAKPLMFQSRVANLALQFQYEVNNFTQHMAHDLGFKNKAELGRLMVYSYLFNQVMQGLMNRKPLFDPIAGVVDAVTMDKKPEDSATDDLLKRMGRLGGEVLGNIAGGQTIAGIIPEDIRKKYMGSTEIGMYGSGPPLVGAIQQAIKKPTTAISNFVLPFGGGQIKKTLRGMEALSRLPKETKGKSLKMIGFGPYSDKDVGAKYSELKKQDRKKLKKRK